MTDGRHRSLDRLRRALERALGRPPRRPPTRRPRRGPDAAGDGVPVDPPRHPTLSGGAEAPLDA